MSAKTLQRLSLSLGALFFGILILVVSLVMTSQVISSGGGRVGTRKFYFASDIKPDHVLYPIFMAFDHLKLERSALKDQVLLKLVYADRRLTHSQELLAQGDEDLAFSTLSKSQKYLLSAVETAQDLEMSSHQKLQLADLVKTQSQKTKSVASGCSDAHQAVLNRLVEETEVATRGLE